MEYGNGVYTEYTYDENTFRLINLVTTKPGSPVEILQDLYFTYDAVGNITWKRDEAVPITFYNNDITDGDNEYTYDALYRLIEATGRESQTAATFGTDDNYDDAPFIP